MICWQNLSFPFLFVCKIHSKEVVLEHQHIFILSKNAHNSQNIFPFSLFETSGCFQILSQNNSVIGTWFTFYMEWDETNVKFSIIKKPLLTRMPMLWKTLVLLTLKQSLMCFLNRYSSGFYTQIHTLNPDILSLLDLLSLTLKQGQDKVS